MGLPYETLISLSFLDNVGQQMSLCHDRYIRIKAITRELITYLIRKHLKLVLRCNSRSL